jgi:4-amino-4-deoxy-L-arabinose transferase-like glycosyltransferase/membrane-associated phospholipid phosphatase
MQWPQALDTALFHFINGSLSNPLFDWLMPVLSGAGNVMHWFALAAVLAFVAALIFGNVRTRVCALMIVLSVGITDGLVVNTIKHAVARPRPCIALSDVVERLGCTNSGSMPSAHAANWFAVTMIVFIYYRRKWTMVGPVLFMAMAVSFSRVYNGVHYPGDVLAGAIIGAGCAAAVAVAVESCWHHVGRTFFPLWYPRMPSLLNPEMRGEPMPESLETTDSHWLRLGYILIVISLLGRWLYLASGKIELSGDEAYQWLWSKHLALSYYSKPPGIALIQFAGTSLFGDTALGVRFFSPVIAAALSWITLRFIAEEIGGCAAFWFLLAVNAIPLLVAGSILMTIDPPLVLFWTCALIAGWRAVQPDGLMRDWIAVGLAMGLAFLCKYSAFYQIICFGIFFALWAPSRIQLRKPGPWLALLIFLICTLPVIIWNAQHGWVTVGHVAGNAGLHSEWKPWKYIGSFWGGTFGVLNPFFFIGALCAGFAFWKSRRENPLMLYLFCMSWPVFLGHAIYSLRYNVQLNWIAPAVPGMFLLMVIYWNERAREGSRLVKPFLAAGLAVGFLAAAILYDPDLIGKLAGAPLPAAMNPANRIRGWDTTATLAQDELTKLEARGNTAFIIASDYDMTGELTFYALPARKAAELKLPIVFCLDRGEPTSQFYFWPEYDYRFTRKGENALFLWDVGPGKVEKGWIWKWLRHEPVTTYPPSPFHPWTPVFQQFETNKDLGVQEIKSRGQVVRYVHVWECYHVK